MGRRLAHKDGAGPAGGVGLDRQIEERWEALRRSSDLSARAFASLEKGAKYDHLERMRVHLEALRRALRAEQERSGIYADIARLLEKKIEAMKDEVRLGNRKE